MVVSWVLLVVVVILRIMGIIETVTLVSDGSLGLVQLRSNDRRRYHSSLIGLLFDQIGS